ncbi:MAG TPA: DUF3667 domain-containing protein [Pyrinomonadaceae bacterium]
MAEVAQTAGRVVPRADVDAPAAPPDAPTGAERAGVAPDAPAVCPECGEALTGDFCHRCGEKRPEARDLSVRHFFGETAKELTNLDSKLFRTLRALLFRPGFLTNEWVAGRRLRYLKPLNLCLGIFAISLFAYTASKQVTMYDVGHIVREERKLAEQWKLRGGSAYERLFAYAARRRNVSPESLYEPINLKWQRNVSLLQPVQILLLAVLLYLVYFFSGRYFVEHLIFAMHFLSFAALTTTMMWPVYYFLGMQVTEANMFVSLSKFAVDILYLFLALRAVYRGQPALVLVLSFVVFAGYVAIYAGTYMVALAAAMLSVFFL